MNEEKPILFKDPMVKSILNGRKNQTRRIIADYRRYKDWNHFQRTLPDFAEDFPGADENSWLLQKERGPLVDSEFQPTSCKYGVSGTILWVRECFANTALAGYSPFYFYRADDPETNDFFKWKPSIFMPRDACRILLEIEETRIERLQDISPEDAWCEGIDPHESIHPDEINYREVFAQLWDSINAKPKKVMGKDKYGNKVIDHYVSYPWADGNFEKTYRDKDWLIFGDPLVWRIQFKHLNPIKSKTNDEIRN